VDQDALLAAELPHGAQGGLERGVADRAVAEGDVDVLEARRAYCVGRAVRAGLHGLAQVEHHVASRALQSGEMLDARLAARHDSGQGLARVGDARDGVEQLAHKDERGYLTAKCSAFA